MRRMIALLLCAVSFAGVMSLYGCGGSHTTAEHETAAAAPTEAHTAASVPALYQISPDSSTLMMCYVIKTKSDKLIVIDGGGVATRDQNQGYLYAKLQEISGRKVPEVEAWFLSHLHDDHVTEFALLALDPEKEIKINNVYFNFPSREFMERTENGKFAYLYDDIKNAYDRLFGEGSFAAVQGKSVKQGDTMNIDGVEIEILLTVQDSEAETNINDTSLIFRATIEGQKVLFLGDAAVSEGNRLLSVHGRDHLESDIVQMAHHGQGGVSRLIYRAIKPTLCLWPSPDWVYDNWNGNLQTFEVREWMADLKVQYHFVTGLSGTQVLTFPVDFSALQPLDIMPAK